MLSGAVVPSFPTRPLHHTALLCAADPRENKRAVVGLSWPSARTKILEKTPHAINLVSHLRPIKSSISLAVIHSITRTLGSGLTAIDTLAIVHTQRTKPAGRLSKYFVSAFLFS